VDKAKAIAALRKLWATNAHYVFDDFDEDELSGGEVRQHMKGVMESLSPSLGDPVPLCRYLEARTDDEKEAILSEALPDGETHLRTKYPPPTN